MSELVRPYPPGSDIIEVFYIRSAEYRRRHRAEFGRTLVRVVRRELILDEVWKRQLLVDAGMYSSDPLYRIGIGISISDYSPTDPGMWTVDHELTDDEVWDLIKRWVNRDE